MFTNFSFTTQLIVGIVAFLLALVFDWFPPVAKWYDGQADGSKRAWMALFLLLTTVAMFVLGCYKVFTLDVTCTAQGGYTAFMVLLQAIVINQGSHALLKPTAAQKTTLKIG